MKIGLGIGVTQPQNVPLASMQNPSSLFLQGEQGAWYDPSDINLTWRRNLLTYSEQFDNAVWNKVSSAAVTVNAAIAPDGAMTADKLVENTTNNTQFYTSRNIDYTTGIYSNTIYAKAAERNWLYFEVGNTYANFNLILGSFGSSGSFGSGWTFGSASITPVGNGWYRCTITSTCTAAGIYTASKIHPAVSDGGIVYQGVIGNGIYIWGAQLELGNTATTYQRITDGIKDYLDYNPLPVLYQDAAGTTPCTAVEQPVGLMLDKSKGLVLGSEINPSGFTNWTAAGFTYSGGNLSYANAGGVTAYPQVNIFPSATSMIRVSIFVTAVSGAVQIANQGGSQSVSLSLGQNTATLRPGSDLKLLFIFPASSSISMSSFSVRELPGNHAFNSSGNSANFPVLSARYNLLTKTEDFSDTVLWSSATGAGSSVTRTANASVAPDGTTTADRLVIVNAGNFALLQQVVTVISGAPRSFGLWIKSNTGSNQTFSIGDDQGTTLSVTATSAWTFVQHSQTIASTIGKFQIIGWGGTTDILVWGADMRYSNDALNQPVYQRVNTATDYDTVGFKPYLRTNGINQWLQTNSIDFSGTDKMLVCAGVRKLSDAAAGILVEISTGGGAGRLYVVASNPGGSANYEIQSVGSGFATAVTSNLFSAPTTNVFSSISDISGDRAILRINGTQAAISTSDQGTGSYGNYPLYIGARAGSSLFFNGRLYGLLVRGAQTGITNIQLTERYMNTKTAAYLEAPSGSVDFLVTNAGDYLVTSEQDYLYAID